MSQTIHSSTHSTVPKAPSTAGPHAKGLIKHSVPHITTSERLSFSKVPFTLSDHQLLTLCTQYGSQAKLWRQKFLGLLPEVDKRKLYLQAGCFSVFEFAAKVGGVSREQVLLTLRLDKRFDTVTELKQALTSGEVSVHKLARVASIATPDNQGFWLQKSKILSQGALEVLVKDSKSMRTHASNSNKIEKVEQFNELGLSPDIRERLINLRNRGLDLNQLLETFLNQREEKIQQEKLKISEELNTSSIKKHTGIALQKHHKLSKISKSQPSRYIPTKVKQLLKQDYGDKCAQETCTNKAANIHHTRRFGLDPSHNPFFLAPLCRQHHEIAHSLDIKTTWYKTYH